WTPTKTAPEKPATSAMATAAAPTKHATSALSDSAPSSTASGILIETGVFLRTSSNKHLVGWIRTTMGIYRLRNFARRNRVLSSPVATCRLTPTGSQIPLRRRHGENCEGAWQ